MMMKDWLADRLHRFLGLALGAAALAALACGMLPHQARAETAHPALWVIHDADSTVYLFGTIHVMKADVDWFSPGLHKRFDSAGDLWLEVPDLDNTAGVVQAMQTYALNPAGDMTKGLSDDEIKKIDELGAPYGMSAARMQGFKKWAVGLVLMTQKISAMGYNPKVGVDLTLLQAARTASKPVHGFETLDQQMQILAPTSDADDAAALRQSLKDTETLGTDLPPLLKAWEEGDEATLSRELVERMKKEDPAGYQRIIVARNAAWEPQVEDILKGKGTVFIAVGAGHLVGPDSLIAMLKTHGITAERVEP
ncbi:TraB/GumN family protein [Asticcacaulis solisilvae]|uniref:TraB/GumN family protein n=1 Tax=Asticcacaulis solisilvae TaxID=1217274 RepID=UPI003FD7B3E8